MRGFLLSLCLSLLLGCGCASRHFPEDSREAERAIERAKDAGADEHSTALLRAAEDTLELARDAEKDATEDRETSQRQLEAAKRRQVRATQRLEGRKASLRSEEDQRELHANVIERLRTRTSELREKNGLEDEQVKTLMLPEVALAQARLRTTDARLASLRKEVELFQLELKDTDLDVDAARARLDTAERRLEVARSLFRTAEEQAKLAETESVEAKRVESSARLSTSM